MSNKQSRVGAHAADHLILQAVEGMFAYLEGLEDVLARAPASGVNALRAGLGLADYRFVDRPSVTASFSCGAQVKFVFLGREEAKRRAAAVDLTPGSVPSATVNDPDACRQRGLCFPHRVRQEFTICGQGVVIARNAAPYGLNHGLVRSREHEPQALCFEPPRLSLTSAVASALGSETGRSLYEVWVAGEGFNTQWHYHAQFRKQRGPIWEYAESPGRPVEDCVRLDAYPSRPFYIQSHNREHLVEMISERVSTFATASRPALGLLLAYDEGRWKALLVSSWRPRGERVFDKQLGLHEHLGEVVLESEDEFGRAKADPAGAARILEEHLTKWCARRQAD